MTVALALFGIVGTLGGTYLGAWLSARQADRAEALRRADNTDARRREVQAAARLLHAELGMAGLLADSGANDGSLISMSLASVEAWTAHGALLAAELPDAVHATVAETCTKVAAVVTAVAALQSAAGANISDDDVRRVVLPLLGLIQEAQVALAPFAYPTGHAESAFFVPVARQN